jgi:hypothetical protein
MHRFLALSWFVAVSLVDRGARAEEPRIADDRAHPLHGAFGLDAQLGGVAGDVVGPLFSIGAFYRYDLIEVGLLTDAACCLPSRTSVGALVGWNGRHETGKGFELLGELGAHAYQGVGGSILGGDPGASGTLPYAGIRLAFASSHQPAEGRHIAGLLRISLFARSDLSRGHAEYAYNSVGFFTGTQQTGNAEHYFGGAEVGLALGGGFEIR